MLGRTEARAGRRTRSETSERECHGRDELSCLLISLVEAGVAK